MGTTLVTRVLLLPAKGEEGDTVLAAHFIRGEILRHLHKHQGGAL